ncbi:uncharacterized protein, partial [Lepeophtheirus salmonis]|uniref:uncharacterized protein n=1 Tax=Lepeophtheirus salmonis TaxID=72036 RepID=UPI003AF3C9A7
MESFEAIVGYGENSAIIHHRSSDSLVKDNSVMLIDCGSKYEFGTTDITRVLHFGEPTDYMKKMYTLVLKGHLKGKMLKTKQKLYENAVSAVTRLYLGFEDEDYPHAFGHGIAHIGNVHEKTYYKEGSVFTIEPGWYKE